MENVFDINKKIRIRRTNVINIEPLKINPTGSYSYVGLYKIRLKYGNKFIVRKYTLVEFKKTGKQFIFIDRNDIIYKYTPNENLLTLGE